MLLSMTGFASKSYEFSWGSVQFEISSVNHKYQDFSVKLPKELASLENKVLSLMRSLIARGKVKLSAEITWNSNSQVPVLNEEGLINLYNKVRTITKRNHWECPNDIAGYLSVPGILDVSQNLAELEARKNPKTWDTMVIEVIDDLIEMKKSEGQKLKSKIEADIESLEILSKLMNKRWKIAKDNAIEAIRIRIEYVLDHYNLELDEARIAYEVSLAADKWDISEEIARMEAHIGKFKELINLNESSGKKLDFLIQEMNREINTMGSKVSDAEFRWQVVEAKSTIEKIREQIQNIE